MVNSLIRPGDRFEHFAVSEIILEGAFIEFHFSRTSRNPLEEVYREIGIVQKLKHPNIIRLIEVVDEEDDDNLYLVFERLERELMEIPCGM